MSVLRTSQLLMATALTIIIGACGPLDSRPTYDEASHLSFRLFSNASSCTLADARKPSLKVCVQGSVGQQVLDKAKKFSKRAVLQWFRALKQIDGKVTKNIDFNCSAGSDLNISLRPGGGTAFAGCGKTTIYETRPYGTYLHEFGHALAGLSDTYVGGSAGSCQSGQPKSVMCWGAYGKKDSEGFSMLYPDDVEGIQTQYRKLFKDLQPPSFQVDPFANLNPENPWPQDGSNPITTTNPQSLGTNLFAAFGNRDNSGSETYAVIVSTPLGDNAVFACEGDQEISCTSDASRRINAKEIKVVEDRRLFLLLKPISLTAGKLVSLFSSKADGETSKWSNARKIRFESASW